MTQQQTPETNTGSAAEPPGRHYQPVADEQRDLGDVLKVSGNLAKAAGALTRRLTVDIAGQTIETGREIIDGARQGKSTDEIASTVVNGWIDGARKVLGFDEEINRMGQELKQAAQPVANLMPDQVKQVAQQVTSFAPVKTVTDVTGLSIGEVRQNLRDKANRLIKRSRKLDDPDEHPAMSVVLDELSPDEIRIVKTLGEGGPQAVIDVVAWNPMSRKKRDLLHNFSFVAQYAGCMRPQESTIYLNNLERLGIIAVRPYRLRSQRNYDLLACQPEVMQLKKPKGRMVRMKQVLKGVELSDFGRALFSHCLESEDVHLAPVPDEL